MGPVGETGGELVVLGTMRDRWRKALETKRFSLYASSARGTCREGSLTRDPGGYITGGGHGKRASLFIGDRRGTWRVVRLPGTLRGSKRPLCTRSVSLSMRALWNLEGGILYWELWKLRKTCQGRPSLLVEAPWGNLEGGLLYWRLWDTCNARLWNRRISFIGLHKGNLRH